MLLLLLLLLVLLVLLMLLVEVMMLLNRSTDHTPDNLHLLLLVLRDGWWEPTGSTRPIPTHPAELVLLVVRLLLLLLLLRHVCRVHRVRRSPPLHGCPAGGGPALPVTRRLSRVVVLLLGCHCSSTTTSSSVIMVRCLRLSWLTVNLLSVVEPVVESLLLSCRPCRCATTTTTSGVVVPRSRYRNL